MLPKPALIASTDFVSRLLKARALAPASYKAMYSSWLGGIVTSPELMILPIDDHLVHRGDGVFEAFRVAFGAIYDLEGHLRRLENSASRIGLKLPGTADEIKQICVETVRASGLSEAVIRLFVARGPGSFSPNPYECVASQLYIVVTEFKPLPESKYSAGARVMVSKVPQKPAPYSQIKSCNYLQNVMMKMEAVDAGYDFSVSLNDEGVVCEGATENIFLYSGDRRLLVPRFDYTLRGTTLLALLGLAEEKLKQEVASVEFVDLKPGDFVQAKEVFMAGTTMGILPVSQFGDRSIGAGGAGPLAKNLRELLIEDMRSNSYRRTPLA